MRSHRLQLLAVAVLAAPYPLLRTLNLAAWARIRASYVGAAASLD